jgi:hypothetical protein
MPRQHARQDVGAAAGRRIHHDEHRARWIICLRARFATQRNAEQRDQEGRGDRRHAKNRLR